MSWFNLSGNIEDSIKVKKEQEIYAALWNVVPMHFKYFCLKNKVDEMGKYEASFYTWELTNMEVYIRSKVSLYPEILKKSSILAKYWG